MVIYTIDYVIYGCCISFDSYIKPQRCNNSGFSRTSCISFDSYIKPQLVVLISLCGLRCISFDSYIKPQRYSAMVIFLSVVYLLIPTSNHNQKSQENVNKSVVYLLIPTSNHNHNWIILVLELLYIF